MGSNTIVAKFGGTSLANAHQVKKVIDIIRKYAADKLYVIVSAPGERFPGDTKVTDLLYKLHATKSSNPMFQETLAAISARFQKIIDGLEISFDLGRHMKILAEALVKENASSEFIASRGEFIMASIIAQAVDGEFIDAAECIRFNTSGTFDMEATKRCRSRIENSASICIMPGFYGSTRTQVKTFARGGSDITGAIVSVLVGATVYDTWKDVSGIFAADPKIIPNAKHIEELTYPELQELAYTGANVLHDEVAFMLEEHGIRIHVRNTNKPDDPGTWVVPCSELPERKPGSIVGIAGREGFSVFSVRKPSMNKELGFAHDMLGVFKDLNISIEHVPGGINSLSVIVSNKALTSTSPAMIEEHLRKKCSTENVSTRVDMALICVVGCALVQTPKVYAALFGGLANEDISVRAISEGSDGTSIVVGVDNRDYERAVCAIYSAFEF